MSENLIAILSAGGSVLAGLAGMIVTYQLILIKKHFLEDHRIRRNSLANELIRWWVQQVSPEFSAARQLVEKLGTDECKSLVNNNAFHIAIPNDTESHKQRREFILEKLRICLGSRFEKLSITEETVGIPAPEGSVIRSLVTRYLNANESVFSAWRHGIASREIIEEEFIYIRSVPK